MVKRIILLLLISLPLCLQAGVIVKKSGERLEDVSIKAVTDMEIQYVDADGAQASIARSEVSAVLYDDGRYEEIKQTVGGYNNNVSLSSGNTTKISVFGFGKSAANFLVALPEYDGTQVEYRIVRDSEESEFQYLGTTPFAFLTARQADIVRSASKLYAGADAYMKVEPLVVENYKAGKVKIEFRLSKPGYETVVVSPMIKLDFTGLICVIPLNRLKPSKNGSSQEVAVAGAAVSAPAEEKRMIPQACLNDGKNAYEQAFDEAQAKALRQGYSKSQAKTIADEAGKNAEQAAIDECYHRIVVLGEDYQPVDPKQQARDKAQAHADSIKQAREQARAMAQARADSIKQAKALAKEQELLEKQRKEAEIASRADFFVTRVSAHEYICEGNTMNKKAYKKFLRNNCPEAYAKWVKGSKEIKAGWSLFGIGLALNAGWVWFSSPDIFGELNMDFSLKENIGLIAGIAGSGMMFISIPLLGDGYAKQKKTCKIYNEQCAGKDKAQVSLRLNASPGGLGLALQF